MIVHALGGKAVVPVAFHLILEGADHLAVAEIAALADVDVPARQLQRRVGAHPVHLLDGRLQVEQRRDLDEAADGDHEENAEKQDEGVLLKGCVAEFHDRLLLGRKSLRTAQLGRCGDARVGLRDPRTHRPGSCATRCRP